MGLLAASAAALLPAATCGAPPAAEARVGTAFANWSDLKRDYKAIGDGKADDSAALQHALNDLKGESKSHCLFIPAGTYRITATLNMVSTINFTIIGGHSATTCIRWDGAAGGTMLLCNGARYGRFSGVAWDGARRAETAVAHQWDGHTQNANTHNEHSDEVFRDVAYGIRAGLPHYMDAECAVLRCRFERCSKAAVSIESFNALDWFICNCEFAECRVGVTNDPGAGNFHVYDSVFRRSQDADIKIGNCAYFGLRRNTSLASKAFLVAAKHGCAAQLTLERNYVFDSVDATSIRVGDVGPVVLLDNLITRTGDAAAAKPLIEVAEARTTVAVANRFSSEPTISATNGRVTEIDTVVEKNALPGVPADVGPQTNTSSPHVIEIAPAEADKLQEAIDAAAQLPAATVHLQSGDFVVAATLTVPSGNTVHIIGDGYATRLLWRGHGRGPVLQLNGPSRAVLSDLTVDGGESADGVVFASCDQPGSRVVMEQGEVQNASDVGLLASALRHCLIDLRDFYHSDCRGVAVKAIGVGRDVGKSESRVAIFGGASSNNGLSYDVVNGGRIVAEDIWYEGKPPQFIDLTAASSGSLTLNGATTATGIGAPNTAAADAAAVGINIDGFGGDVALVNVNIGTRLHIGGADSKTRVLGILHGDNGFLVDEAHDERIALLAGTTKLAGGGAVAQESRRDVDPQTLRALLAPLRETNPDTRASVPAGATDAFIHRVNVRNTIVAFQLGGNE